MSAVAGVLCEIAVALPWIRTPIGFERLRVLGIGTREGLAVGVLGLLLLMATLVALRRPSTRFRIGWHAAAACALGALAVSSRLHVRQLLSEPVHGIGVHPGIVGPGVQLVWVAFAVQAAAVLVVASHRRVRRAD